MAKVQRGDVSTLILPDQVSEEILTGVAESSVIRRLAKTRQMTANRVKLTEAEVNGANVFWVGEGQRKSTDAPDMSSATWTMQAAELAVIIPIDENVQDDANRDMFELYKPQIQTAVARKLDAATLFGLDVPSDWGQASIKAQATLAGHVFTEDGSPNISELLTLIAGSGATTADGALQAIEDDGYDPESILAYVRFRARLRNAQDADGRPIFGQPSGPTIPGTLYGLPIEFVKGTNAGSDGFWVPADAHLVVGDWSQAEIGTRQELKYKLFDQGVVTDGAGNVVYSLMESDMLALRVTARFGFKVYAPDTADGETVADGDKYPFAIVRPAQS